MGAWVWSVRLGRNVLAAGQNAVVAAAVAEPTTNRTAAEVRAMNRAERQELEKARQNAIHRYNEEAAEDARRELSRASCGAGCEDCDPATCPRAVRVDVFEIPE